MTLTDSEISEARELLVAAVENPFFGSGVADTQISSWFSFLVERFPLMTFQTDVYLYQLGDTDLPTTDPLARILLRVLRDEGWSGWDFAGNSDTAFALEFNLAARRRELGSANTGFFGSCLATQNEDGAWRRIDQANSLRRLTEPEPILDWDDDGPIGVATTVYEEIGRELVGLIEHRDAQEPTSQEAEEAQAAIDDFLKSISARRGKGRPPTVTTGEILAALYREGTDLLEVVWAGFTAGPSDATQAFLADHGIVEPTDQEFWAKRLALPVFSARELEAVGRSEGGVKWLTPRRLAIFFLARRLDLSSPHVARRVVGADEEEAFKRHADLPI